MSIVLHNFGQSPAIQHEKYVLKRTPPNTNFLEPPCPCIYCDTASGADHGLPIGLQADASAETTASKIRLD